ncbi:MAG: hypothetical protein AB8E82_19970 [Aureispira sp.]
MKYIGIITVVIIILGVIFFLSRTKQSPQPPTNDNNSRQEGNKMKHHKDSLQKELDQLLLKRLEKQKVLDLLKDTEELQKKEKEQWEKSNNAKKDLAEKNGDSDTFHNLLIEQIALSDTLQSTQEEIGNTLHELSDLGAKISDIEDQLD